VQGPGWLPPGAMGFVRRDRGTISDHRRNVDQGRSTSILSWMTTIDTHETGLGSVRYIRGKGHVRYPCPATNSTIKAATIVANGLTDGAGMVE
jgi:hypothetical protein